MKKKSVLKAGANAGAGAGKFGVAGGGNDEGFGGGGRERVVGDESALSSLVLEERYTREVASGYSCTLFRASYPAQCEGYYEELLTEAA